MQGAADSDPPSPMERQYVVGTRLPLPAHVPGRFGDRPSVAHGAPMTGGHPLGIACFIVLGDSEIAPPVECSRSDVLLWCSAAVLPQSLANGCVPSGTMHQRGNPTCLAAWRF